MESETTSAVRVEGEALVLFAFDIGFQVDLERASTLARGSEPLKVVRSRRPAPEWFDYSPAPLRLEMGGEPVAIGGLETAAVVDVLVYDFGAALVRFRLGLPETLEGVARLSAELYGHRALEEEARARVERLVETIRAAVERSGVADAVEDYTVFAVREWGEGVSPRKVFERERRAIAAAIEAERGELSEEQTARSTSASMQYSADDLAVFGWNSAVLFDREPEDVIALVQHANIELLELRILDQQLDEILDHADETLAALVQKRLWPGFASGRMLRTFAAAQTDAAVMFEGVNNAIKLLGNQYLARLYRLMAERLDLPAWQASVQRKLEATESLYGKISDTTGTRRLETLEWVIIILIAVSIILPFTGLYH